MTLSDYHKVLDKWLYIEDDKVVDIFLAAVVANQFSGPSLSMHIVGPPSSGKTQLISSFQWYDKVYHLSTLTPQAFASGFKGNLGLLNRMNEEGKNIIMLKDFTSILSMRSEARNEIIGAIREIADGYYSKSAGGPVKEIAWRGKIGFISGVTQAIEAAHAISQQLGERFIIVRLKQNHPMQQAKKSQESDGLEDQMNLEISDACRLLFNSLNFNLPPIDDITSDWILRVASYISFCRTPVPRNHFKEVEYLADTESPARLGKQLRQIYRGLIVLGVNNPIPHLRLIAHDSIPAIRYKILHYLWCEHDYTPTDATTIAADISFPKSNLYKYLEDMYMIGMLNQINENPYKYRISDVLGGYLSDGLF